MAARRWYDLTKPYRQRITAYSKAHPELGKTPAQIWRDPDLRRAATGHAATPRTPAQALRHPRRYLDYVQRNWDRLQARVGTPRGEAQAQAGLSEERKAFIAQTGPVPLSLYKPSDTEGMRRQTFPRLDEAEDYLIPVRHLVEQGMAWIVPDMHRGEMNFEIWILRVTP